MSEAATADQQFFGYFLESEDAWLTPKEAGALLADQSEDFIREAFESGDLPGLALNSQGKNKRERYQRYIIPRSALSLYAMECANFTPADFMRRLKQLADRLPHQQRKELIQHLMQ